MAQATDELREKMRKEFGSPIDDEGPIAHLEHVAGLILDYDRWMWIVPVGYTLSQLDHD